ncbi:MAG: beta-ketoacyl-[acyl-carrier-protein] synthase family protein [Elusimicrobiota bacterium]|jgi:3-oxoacyl-(acyl-carrier-protein) synthase
MKRVAITGFGIVSPIGIGRQEFWNALTQGMSGIAPISLFDARSFQVQLAGEIKTHPDLPQKAASAAREDRKVGFAYLACAQSMEQAGLTSFDEGTLLHLGTSLETFDLEKVIIDGKPDFKAVATRNLNNGPALQVPLDTAARLLADAFGRPGRSLTNCSACAAGTQAIGHSFQAVRSGRFRKAVCGGFDSMLNPLGVGGFQLLGALTTDNARGSSACRPFDSERQGTVLGEGAAIFVLEPLEEAASAGKDILAEILGYASTFDAHSLSAPDPEGSGAIRAMSGALSDAGISAEQIMHVNAHGTGTLLNDQTEAHAVRHVLGKHWERVPVSATKSMTGHLIAAAGAVETGACLLPIVRGILPPNPSLERVGTGCELNHVRNPGERFLGGYVLKNSFGFGGQNASLVMRKCDG